MKYQIRQPTRFAIRELKKTYLDQVEQQVQTFLSTSIKHDTLVPGREVSLDLTLLDAEVIASANETVKQMASSGELKALFDNVEKLET